MSSARSVYGWLVGLFVAVLLGTAVVFALRDDGAVPEAAPVASTPETASGELAAVPPSTAAPSVLPAAATEAPATLAASAARSAAPDDVPVSPQATHGDGHGHGAHQHGDAAANRLPQASDVVPADRAVNVAFGFSGDRAETERFLAYEREIQLTAEQEAIRVAALEVLPAPCCKEFSAATCCCRCNMALSTWGLAKHLIVHEGAGAERVRAAVAAWHQAINPDGFSGDVCSTGGCGRPFAQNGCGGMSELVY